MLASWIVSSHERDLRNASMSTAGTSSSNRATAWLRGWLSATVMRTAVYATTVPSLSAVIRTSSDWVWPPTVGICGGGFDARTMRWFAALGSTERAALAQCCASDEHYGLMNSSVGSDRRALACWRHSRGDMP